MEEKVFRKHVSWVMFLYSILVVWAHSFNADLFSKGSESPLWKNLAKAQQVFSTEIATSAVAGFFMLSSYLFFRNFTWDKLAGKWKSRFFSVVMPYAAWNLLYYGGYALASRVPFLQRGIGRDVVPITGYELFEAVFHYRYAPVFWYLYQLIILILLSPIIYLLVKNRITGLVTLCLLLLAVHFRFDTQHPNTDALLYYTFAAWMAFHGREPVEFRYGKKRFLAGVLSLILLFSCFVQAHKQGAGVLWTVGYRFFIPVSVWLLFDGRYACDIRPWMRQSLFLYAVHFPIVRLVNKGTAALLGSFAKETAMAAASLIVYAILPMIVVAISYRIAQFLGKYTPAVWRLLSGGRSL